VNGDSAEQTLGLLNIGQSNDAALSFVLAIRSSIFKFPK
jgi:hypothetical protein